MSDTASPTPRPLDGDHLPTGEAKATAVRTMFDDIAPRYDLVNRVMTFRLDERWRTRLVGDLRLPGGSVVADLATGTGDVCRELARQGLTPVGMDFSFGMLANARTEAPLAQADALRLPVGDGSLDGLTCSFALRNLVDLPSFFAECARSVRPGGRIGFLDASQPEHPVLRFGHGIYFGRIVPWIGGLISGKRSAYRYLPASLAYLPDGPELVAQIEAAGFTDVRRDLLTFGAAQLVTATRAEP